MNQQNNRRFSFETEQPEEELTLNKGLRIANKQVLQKYEAKEQFETAVNEIQENHISQMQEALRLGQQYMGLLEDKTLPGNKGPIQRSIEKDVINELQIYATKIDNNENQKIPKCMGTSSIIAMILPAMFKLRDRINLLEYENKQLSKRINDQNSEIKNPLEELTFKSSG